jgi:hypothetical protein
MNGRAFCWCRYGAILEVVERRCWSGAAAVSRCAHCLLRWLAGRRALLVVGVKQGSGVLWAGTAASQGGLSPSPTAYGLSFPERLFAFGKAAS